MSHLDYDVLWAHGGDERPNPAVQAHLNQCAECQEALAGIRLARHAVQSLPEVPPMPESMARRVGHALSQAADAQAAKAFAPWWQSLFTFRFALVSAVAVVLVGFGAWLLAAATPEVAHPAPLAITPSPAPSHPAPSSATPPTPPAPPKKLSVTVASAQHATASKAQVLSEGSTVSTTSGGSVWLKLPDGSKAGLTGVSEVTLAKLEEKELTLDIARGSVALVVPHREDRVLTVRAGELEVKDLGTRFLVSRETTRTLVAVEEGSVEVTTPTGSRVVRANHAVSWSKGQLTELAWETSPPPPREHPSPPSSVARLGDEEEEEPAPEAAPLEAPVAAPSEAKPPIAPDRTPVATDEQWAPMPHEGPRASLSLRNVERKLRELGTAVTAPSVREAGARNVALAADAGDCQHALLLAEHWLAAPVSKAANEFQLRRSVQGQQVRCLTHLGRTQDAAALQRQLDRR